MHGTNFGRKSSKVGIRYNLNASRKRIFLIIGALACCCVDTIACISFNITHQILTRTRSQTHLEERCKSLFRFSILGIVYIYTHTSSSVFFFSWRNLIEIIYSLYDAYHFLLVCFLFCGRGFLYSFSRW